MSSRNGRLALRLLIDGIVLAKVSFFLINRPVSLCSLWLRVVPVRCSDSADAGVGQVTVAPPIEDCLHPFSLLSGSIAVVQGSTLSTSLELTSSRTGFRPLQIGSRGLNDIVLQVWVPLCSRSCATVCYTQTISTTVMQDKVSVEVTFKLSAPAIGYCTSSTRTQCVL